jgi:hypothetical protein
MHERRDKMQHLPGNKIKINATGRVPYSDNIYIYIYKDKAVPLQAWSGPEGSRKLRFADFLKTAQYGGKVVSPTHRPPLPPGNTPGTHFC